MLVRSQDQLKAASSKYLLYDVITGQNDPMYKLIPLVSDLNSNGLRPGNRRNISTTNKTR
jgi:hypothetical protein